MELNKDQTLVVNSEHPFNIVSAGSGTGKTKTVIARAEKFLMAGKRVLITTFTRAAREEIEERIFTLAGGNDDDLEDMAFNPDLLNVNTLGSLGWNISGEDPAEKKDIFKWCADAIKRHKINPKAVPGYKKAKVEKFITDMIDHLERLQANAVTPDEVGNLTDNVLVKLYPDFYKNGPNTQSAMILKATETIYADGEVGDIVRQDWCDFDVIIVDEAQDLNEAQWRLITALRVKANKPVILDLVGDPDQSIYSWRGGIPGFMDPFFHSFTEEEMGEFTLSRNYRSSNQIILPATEILLENTDSDGTPKDLHTDKEGPDVTVSSAPTERAEAKMIAERIEKAVSDGMRFGDIAVIARRHSRLDFIEAALIDRKIPCIRVGADYYERPDVRATILGLKIATSRGEKRRTAIYDLISLRTEDKSLLKRMQRAVEKGNSATHDEDIRAAIESAMRQTERRDDMTNDQVLYQRYLEKLFGPLLLALISVNPAEHSAKEVIELILHGLDLFSWFASMPLWKSRIVTIPQTEENFLWLAAKYPTPAEALAAVTERMIEKESLYDCRDQNAVFLTTPFGAKGLEWEYVIACGLNDKEFPTNASQKYIPNNKLYYRFDPFYSGGLDEERRLFYVMLTRARKRLELTWPMTIRNVAGGSFPTEKSSFLNNLTLVDNSSPMPKRKAI